MGEKQNSGQRQPVIFIGHGSPMNAIAKNSYTSTLQTLGKTLPKPNAILVISAHWLSDQKSLVTHMQNPKTIHDFYGFPPELYKIQYPAQGDPKLAEKVSLLLTQAQFPCDLDNQDWGLDHGSWSVLRHLFPDADVPTIQLSIQTHLPFSSYIQIGSVLADLRNEGVMIIGSGNAVHNLRSLNWNEDAVSFPWANEYQEWIESTLKSENRNTNILKADQVPPYRLAHPTIEHLLPLFYVLGAMSEEEKIEIFFSEIHHSSISMLSFKSN